MQFAGGSQGGERAVEIADPHVEPAERIELPRAIAFGAARTENFQGLGMQRKCRVEFAQRDEAKAVVADHGGVTVRIAFPVEQGQQSLVVTRRPRDLTAPVVDQREIAQRAHQRGRILHGMRQLVGPAEKRRRTGVVAERGVDQPADVGGVGLVESLAVFPEVVDYSCQTLVRDGQQRLLLRAL